MFLLLAVLTSVGAWADENEDLSTPLTLEAATTEGAEVMFTINTSAATNGVEYRTWDGTTWTDWANFTYIIAIELNQGDKV